MFGQMQNQQPQQVQQRQVHVAAPATGNNFDFIRVNSYDEIREFFVPANSGAWFMFQEDPIIAYKFANEMGVPDTKYFKFFEFDPKEEIKQSAENASAQFASAEYVKSLEDQIGAIRAELENIRRMGVNVNAESIEQVYEAEHADTIGTITTAQRRK